MSSEAPSQPPKRPDVDPKCYTLAELFLQEISGWTEDDVWALAKVIQDACEDACREVEDRAQSKSP